MNRIGFIVTTFLRDELLFKSVESLLKYKQDNWEIIIVDQNPTQEKERQYSNCLYYGIPCNSGLSYARNFGVQKAKDLNCEYVFISSDSFLFNESIQKINEMVNFLKETDYSFCGFELENSTGGCGWEAKLNLIEGQSFELDFIDKTKKDFDILGTIKPSKEWCDENNKPSLVGDVIPIWNVDICRNIFIAKTDMLLDVKWDENFFLGEHEDEFFRLKQSGYKGCWTDYIYATKMTDRPNEYAEFRRKNFNEGIKKLKEKYFIKEWISYRNLEQAKDYYRKKV